MRSASEDSSVEDRFDRSSMSGDSLSAKRSLSDSLTSPSVMFVPNRPRAEELFPVASVLRFHDNQMSILDFHRQLRYGNSSMLIGERPFHCGGLDSAILDSGSDVMRTVASIRGGRDVEHSDDDDDENAYSVTSQQADGTRCDSPTTSGADGCSAVATAGDSIGNQFHRRRRRTAFTSEQVR